MRKTRQLMKELTTPQPSDKDRMIVDEYMTNGFKKGAAVTTVLGTPNPGYFSVMMQKPAVKAYLSELQLQSQADAKITPSQLTNQFKNWAFSDATQFMMLTEEEMQELPFEIKSCIQSYEVIETTVELKSGGSKHIKRIKVKLVDKKGAMENLARHIGYYKADNDQKANVINLENMPKDDLMALAEIFERLGRSDSEANNSKGIKTIDIS